MSVEADWRCSWTSRRRFGRIDVLANNAGLWAPGAESRVPEDDVASVLEPISRPFAIGPPYHACPRAARSSSHERVSVRAGRVGSLLGQRSA